MKNPRIRTLVIWKTSYWRHQKHAVRWCHDYGLKPLTSTAFIGQLTHREQKEIVTKFTGLLNGKRELFYILPICQSCWTTAGIHDKIKRNIDNIPDFEII